MNKSPPDNSSSVTHKRLLQSPGCNELNASLKLWKLIKNNQNTRLPSLSNYV